MSTTEFKNPKNKVFLLLRGKDKNVIRIWIDAKSKAYKVEIRTPNFAAYLNVAEFVDRVKLK